MKMSNVAKTEKGFIEKELTIKNLSNGEYLIEAKAIPVGKKEEETIQMTFTQNGLNALVGTWMVFCNEEHK